MRDLTRLEEIFIKETIREKNDKVVMAGRPWCKQYLRYNKQHLHCPHFKTCSMYWMIREKIRMGVTVVESDFELEQFHLGNLDFEQEQSQEDDAEAQGGL
ncbi:hypothetical protein C4561_01700 [candidate division WWE3 bacterium]|uniref:Uncharacterized protein n=1 Tax=candidate division WWE3 bacterium TaxID=2053526 RepID=A0A3A4ZEP9_UNCKA|nr:MAG: hypothetical protein C4561_01700 [candidate division WWE3 bacterium]